jgi:hypothetical protein
MADVVECLARYVREVISLARGDISAAVKSREWFLKRVMAVVGSRRAEPSLIADQPFLLYGSYRKGTKVAAVDEFDILVRIDSNTGVFAQGGIQMAHGQGSANPNHKYHTKYLLDDQPAVSPTKMLNWVRSVACEVVEPYGGEVPERDGPAVTVIIKSQDLQLDLVPGGVFTRRTDGKTFYNIPRGVNSRDWILTAPEDDIARLEAASQQRQNFKNVIRICKRVKDQYNFGISSFAIETSVVGYIYSNTWHQNCHRDLDGVLAQLATDLSNAHIPDPLNSTNLLEGINTETLRWYADRLQDIRTGLEAATRMSDEQRAYEHVRALLEND